MSDVKLDCNLLCIQVQVYLYCCFCKREVLVSIYRSSSTRMSLHLPWNRLFELFPNLDSNKIEHYR